MKIVGSVDISGNQGTVYYFPENDYCLSDNVLGHVSQDPSVIGGGSFFF